MYVSAVSAEIVDGTLPEKRLWARFLRNIVIRMPGSAGRPHRRRAAYRSTSLVSAVRLARIGPVKPFSSKYLITHVEACGRTERGPDAQPRAREARHAPHRKRARPREGDAQPRERGQRGDRRRQPAGEAVIAEGPAPQRAHPARASRPEPRMAAVGRTGRPAW
jgi:hypothetical protein